MAKTDKEKYKKSKDNEATDFHALKPLRGGGSKHSINRHKHHSSTASYESGHTHYQRGACYQCLKTGLSCYNFMILLMGLGALGVGVWMMVKDMNAREISFIVGQKYYEIGACLLIAAGGIVALLAFCGCCGTMKEDRCVLGFYATTLCIMLCSVIGACALVFIFREHLSKKIKLRMSEMVIEKYGVNLRQTEHKAVTEAWDSMQRELGCCGAHGNINSTYSWVVFTKSEWYRSGTSGKMNYVPESCCKTDRIDLCTGVKPFPGPPFRGPPVPYKRGDKLNPHLYTTGCYDKLIERLNEHIVIVGVIAAAIPVFLLIGTVIAFILCGMVRKDDYDDKLGG